MLVSMHLPDAVLSVESETGLPPEMAEKTQTIIAQVMLNTSQSLPLL